MCGIAGFAGEIHSGSAQEAVASMVHSLRFRGPDSAGQESWPGAVLGHRRLAILDLSPAGAQPMFTEDRQIGLVFNGCIYNFQELRENLEREGVRFRSQTDTEVLLLGYRQWGIEKLLSQCRGMFAFAIWDDSADKLILVRDRLGVKPLLYKVAGRTIAFASTVTALHDAGLASQLDPAAVLDFLEFGWVSEDRSIYKDVHKVPAAGMIVFEHGKISQSIYWRPPGSGSLKISFDEAVEETERLLVESVRLRLIADVPIGSLLSGGIDSSLIAWALHRLNANVNCYTVATPGHPGDEFPAAAATAATLGISHQAVALDPSEAPNLDELSAAYGEPFACSSALGMLKVCRAVKSKATVLLTGDGGDDVFLGYTHHLNFYRAQRLAGFVPPLAASCWPALRGLLPDSGPGRRAKHLIDYATGGLGAVTRTHDGLPYFERRSMLGPRLSSLSLTDRMIPLQLSSGRRLLDNFLSYEWRTRFLAEYMTKVDGAAMRYAIEARSPFLDQKLWEFAAALPLSLRLRNGELKAILREIARRRVSPAVAQRSKQGFTIPVSDWLTSHWRPQLEALSSGSRLAAQGWIDPKALSLALSEAVAFGKVPVQLWYLLVLEHWLGRHQLS